MVDKLPVALARRTAYAGLDVLVVGPSLEGVPTNWSRALLRFAAARHFVAAFGTRVLALLGIVAFLVCVDRYVQRTENRENRDVPDDQTWWVTSTLDGLTANQSDALLRENWREAGLEEAPLRRMALLDHLGLAATEARATAFLKRSPNPEGAPTLYNYVKKVLMPSVGRSLDGRRYQLARYKAQRALNILYGLPAIPQSREAYQVTATAHAIVDLVNGNYLYFDRPVVELLRSRIFPSNEGWEFESKSRTQKRAGLKPIEEGVTSESLRDDVTYHNLAIRQQGPTEYLDAEAWDRFVRLFGSSPLAEEGAYNAVVSAMRHIENQKGPPKASDLADFTERVGAFLRRFPTSYLADDVIFLAIATNLCSRNDTRTAATWMHRLYRDYPSLDQAKLVAMRTREAVFGAVGYSERMAHSVEVIVRQAAQSPPVVFASLKLAAQADGAIAGALAPLLGLDEPTLDRMQSEEILIRVLDRWKERLQQR